MPPRKVRRTTSPRRSRRDAVERLIADRVAEAINEHERNRPNPANARGTVNVQSCSHKTFMNGKPYPFNGTEGGVGLRRWIEKLEHVFEICKCAEEDKVMFTTFEGYALTWMEQELWTLTLKGDDIKEYNNHFHELDLMCPDLVPTEKKKVERYIRGFPKRIKGNITSSKPTTLHDAINVGRELVEQAVQGRAARIGESNKRKWEEHQRNTNNNSNNHNNRNRNFNNQHQQQNRRHETTMAYVAAPAEGRGYTGTLPWCNRCKSRHQQGLCPPKCGKCNRLRPQEKDGRTRMPTAAGGNFLQNVACYGFKEKGHFRNKFTGTFLLNDHYACILFDSGAEESFVSTAFTPFIDIASAALGTNLLPTQLGSFDVIAGMDWLSYHRVVIVCYKKIVRIPLPNGEILEIQGERLEKVLKLLSCIKADEKKPEDICIIRDFPEVFPDDLLEVQLLRHVVNRDGIHVEPSKVESVKNWKTPESPMEIRSFLILTGYYRMFIENLSKITKPLTLLTQKNKAYVWGDKQEEAFRILKKKLCNAPVLALPDGPNDFVVYCDASNQGFGCVLMQRGKDFKALAEWLRGLDAQFERRDDGGIYFVDRIWIPSVGGIRKLILDEAHTSKYSVHPEHQKPSGLLQQPEIPEWKREKITMDLVTRLLIIREDFKMEKLVRIYINEIMARHGVPVPIISDRDGRFSSHFWRALQKALGTRLDMSTAYHPQTDCQSEHTIQTLEDMLRASLYGRKCRSLVIWAEIGESQLIGPEIVQETIEKIMQIKERLKTARDH
ncbi:putative reverse transcriptase domain-containing protein [Tanacetum coccineum]|uniref:Reverse transcriptase domain-containing protein n=1 Tax=Tanacetum coccineum TaxID=301880 RepID=A0ABQ4YQQ0_9ASTR